MAILKSHYLILVGLFIALLLPFSLLAITVSSNWWSIYISWVVFFMQSFILILAGLLTYNAAFHRKVLGGTVGVSLRVFAIGLLCLGLGLAQIPFLQAYDLWKTAYVETNLYYTAYVVGGFLLIASSFISGFEYIGRMAGIIVGIIVFGVIFRIALGSIPLHANTYYTTVTAYQQGLTLDVLLFCIVLALVLLAITHTQMFGQSKIGHIFRMQVWGLSWFLVPTFADFLSDTVSGWNNWYTYSLPGSLIFSGSLLIAAIYFYSFGLYLNDFTIS